MPNQPRPYLRGLLTGSALTLLALAAIPAARQSLRPLAVAAVRGARSAGEQAVTYWERTKEEFEDILAEASPDPGLSEPREAPKA